MSRVASALRRRGGKLLSALVLVASIAPVAFVAVPMAQEEYQSFSDRYLERDPLPALEASVPRRLERLAGSVPAYRREREVPVLVYHGIGDESRFSISQDEFARQVAMLDRAGFRTISIAEYADFLDGETAGLPPRPVLITFDDGQLSSFRGADAVLERHGMRAVMYAIAGSAEEGSEFYLSAEELREMTESGRWDIQLHAGDGHHEIAYDAKGRQGPFYAYRAYGDGGLESFAEYRRRVVADLRGGEERLEAEIPAFSTDTFSFPFGAFGQSGSNDKRIRGFLTGWLGERYRALFHQPSNPRFTTPGAPGRVLDRFEIDGRTSATELARWLESGA